MEPKLYAYVVDTGWQDKCAAIIGFGKTYEEAEAAALKRYNEKHGTDYEDIGETGCTDFCTEIASGDSIVCDMP